MRETERDEQGEGLTLFIQFLTSRQGAGWGGLHKLLMYSYCMPPISILMHLGHDECEHGIGYS